MNTKIKRLELESRTKIPRIFDSQAAFQHLFGHITLFAIDKIKFEWNLAKLLYLDIEDYHNLPHNSGIHMRNYVSYGMDCLVSIDCFQ